MFFAMSATYPVAAGLGGGGICLISDPAKGVQEFDFLPRAAKSGGAYAVPGAVRGFYDLQSAFGTLPWQRDVAGGEAYAATGFPISHALFARLGNSQNSIRLDAALAAEFMNENGTPRPEGAIATNQALSQPWQRSAFRRGRFLQGRGGRRLVRFPRPRAVRFPLPIWPIIAPRSQRRVPTVQGGYSVALPNVATGAGQFAQSLFTNAARSTDGKRRGIGGAPEPCQFRYSTLPADWAAPASRRSTAMDRSPPVP